MKGSKEIDFLIKRLPFRKLLIASFLIAWVLLSTVIPVPAPPGGTGGDGPC
ncbi:MAG: hypothetical protein ACFFB3_10590 [Candidatus Hodarchaeota archaeon]